MARATACRSSASSPCSPTVELTNTRSRWSGVQITTAGPPTAESSLSTGWSASRPTQVRDQIGTRYVVCHPLQLAGSSGLRKTGGHNGGWP